MAFRRRHTSSPDLLEAGITVFPTSKVLLHISIEVFTASFDQFIVINITIPGFFDVPEGFSCTANNDAAVGTRYQVIVLLIIKT